MNGRLIFFILSIFLANRSGLNIFILLILALLVGIIYLITYGDSLNKFRQEYLKSRSEGKTIYQGIILTSLFVGLLYFFDKFNILPMWMTKEQINLAALFLALYIPLILIFKLKFKVSIYLAVYFLILIPFLIVGKNEPRAEFFSLMAFLFLFISLFQK